MGGVLQRGTAKMRSWMQVMRNGALGFSTCFTVETRHIDTHPNGFGHISDKDHCASRCLWKRFPSAGPNTGAACIRTAMNSPKNLANAEESSQMFSCLRTSANAGPACMGTKIGYF